MAMNWTELETSTHQDHIIKHVLGATVLGWFIAGEAAHFLLDMGFLWTVYIDGEMNLLPQGVALADLEGDELTETDRTELAFDADLLAHEGRDAQDLKRFTPAEVECLVSSVDFLGSDSRRQIVIRGESARIEVETSPEDGELIISSHEQSS
jgi:hypothetical protein